MAADHEEHLPDSAEEEFTLAPEVEPPESVAEDRQQLLRNSWRAEEETQAEHRSQYSLAQFFLFTTIGSLGFAGTIYFPPTWFAGGLGVIALLFAMGLSIFFPESPLALLLFQALCVVYAFAVLGTAIRQMISP